MKPTVIILVVLCVLGIIAFLALRGRFSENATDGGFRDWVKNPDYKLSAEEYFAERDALTVPDDISQGEIQTMVDLLFVQKDEQFNTDKLKLVGSKATPHLVAALAESRTFTMTFPEGGHVMDAKSPFERICDLLGEICPPEAALPLAKYADHGDKSFRKHAAITLGNIGTLDCLEPMKSLICDDDDYVRSYAMMGIQRGLDGGRCTDEFLNGVFPLLEPLLNRADKSVSGRPPQLLLAINKGRAIPILLSNEYFSVDNRQLHYILGALNEADIKVPHDKLLPLLEELEPITDKYPHGRQFAAALLAYARNPDSNTETLLVKKLESSNEKVAEAAANALGILSGVTDPSGFVFEVLEERGWNNLTQPQKNYYAVLIYDGEVNNGGHSQYFVNSSGNLYSSALDGLRAIGAIKRASILADALQLFGANGPSPDNEKRHEQLAAFSQRQVAQLDSLDSRYCDCAESIDVLLSSYALENKEHFSPGR